MKTRILRVLAFIAFLPICLIAVTIFLPVFILNGYNTLYWIEDVSDYFCGIELRPGRRDNIY